jgi:ankyrin repeat protein
MYLAAKSGNKTIVGLLLQGSATINLKSNKNPALLRGAAAKGNEEVARLLLANGFDVKAHDGYGKTTLYPAAANGKEAMISSY